MTTSINKLKFFAIAAVIAISGAFQMNQSAYAAETATTGSFRQDVLRFTHGNSSVVMRANMTHREDGTSFRAYKTYQSLVSGYSLGTPYYTIWRGDSHATKTVSAPETVRSYGWKANSAFVCVPLYWKGQNVDNMCHTYHSGVWTSKSW